jgi:superfamily II DNA or RNA helicase
VAELLNANMMDGLAITPRPYQAEYDTDIESGWKLAKKQLVVAPTGSGKTYMFSCIAGRFVAHGQRVLILVDQDELVWQTQKALRACAGLECEVEKAELRASLKAQVVIASVQSMMRAERLERWPADHFGLVIADEADKSIAKSWQSVLNHFDSHAKVCGFTATPHRTDQVNLGVYYERSVEKENLVSLIRKGFLCPIRVSRIPIKLDLSAVHIKEGDYDKNELDELIGPHLLRIAETVRDKAEFRKTLVFLPLIKTAVAFADICRDVGLDAQHISGKDPDRDVKWAAFKAWKFDVLANSMLLTRGVDDPQINCLVPCRPTKSITLYFQMVGRGTRIAQGKTDLLLLDFLYQSGTHLICRPAHLVAKDDFEAEQITEMEEKAAGMPGDVAEQLDLVDVADTASSQREAALRKRLEQVKDNQREEIGPEEFALLNHSMDLAEYRPTMSADSKPPTDNQLRWLRKIKIDPNTGKCLMHYAPSNFKPIAVDQIKTVGQASKILGLAFSNEHKGPILASEKVRALMKRAGETDWETASAERGRQFFAALHKK